MLNYFLAVQVVPHPAFSVRKPTLDKSDQPTFGPTLERDPAGSELLPRWQWAGPRLGQWPGWRAWEGPGGGAPPLVPQPRQAKPPPTQGSIAGGCPGCGVGGWRPPQPPHHWPWAQRAGRINYYYYNKGKIPIYATLFHATLCITLNNHSAIHICSLQKKALKQDQNNALKTFR